jgi:hypothetical protein
MPNSVLTERTKNVPLYVKVSTKHMLIYNHFTLFRNKAEEVTILLFIYNLYWPHVYLWKRLKSSSWIHKSLSRGKVNSGIGLTYRHLGYTAGVVGRYTCPRGSTNQQSYAGVDFIAQLGIYEFGNRKIPIIREPCRSVLELEPGRIEQVDLHNGRHQLIIHKAI